MNILFCSSDLDLVKFIDPILTCGGFNFDAVTSYADTYSKLRSQNYDVVILYYSMDYEGDWEVLYDKLRSSPDFGDKIGFILITPKGFFEKNITSNGDRYLPAPFPVQELLMTTRDVLTNYGKSLPTTQEQNEKFETHCVRLKTSLGWNDEKIKKFREDTLRKAGYIHSQ